MVSDYKTYPEVDKRLKKKVDESKGMATILYFMLGLRNKSINIMYLIAKVNCGLIRDLLLMNHRSDRPPLTKRSTGQP